MRFRRIEIKPELFWSCILGFAAGLLGGAVGSQFNSKFENVVVAHEFMLANKNGVPRARLHFDNEGRPELAFYSSSSKGVPLKLGLSKDSGSTAEYPQLSMYRDDGHDYALTILGPAELGLDGERPSIDLNLGRTAGSVVLSCDEAGPAAIMTGNKAHVRICESNKDGGSGNTRAVIGHTDTVDTITGTETGSPLSSMTFFDTTGNVSWKAGY